jgi:hypothetical protein
MFEFISTYLPIALTIQYMICGGAFCIIGKPAPAVYWFGAALLNIGVILMSAKS